MKRFVCLMLALLSVLGLCACKSKNEAPKGDFVADIEFLTSNDWVRIDPTAGDTEYFCMNKDMTFSFWCACGNPVDDSDLYDKFKYDEESGVIKIYNSKLPFVGKEYRLVLYGKNFIVLDINGTLKEFVSEDVEDLFSVEYLCEDTELIEGYTMYKTVTEISDQELTLAPVYYNKDRDKYESEKIRLKLDGDATFENLTVNHADVGDYYSGVEADHQKISLEEAKNLLSYKTRNVFVWLDEDLKVKKAVFYEYNYFDTFIPDEYRHLLDGYSVYRAMTDVSDTEITLAPPYYDGDVKEHREEKVKFKLAKDLVIEELEVHTVYKDDDETTTVKHEVKDMEYLALVLDSTLGGGFVWLNDDLEVCKIMLYGAIYNWE